MKNFFNYVSWIGIYFLMPLMPFLISGIISYKMHILFNPCIYQKGLVTFFESFDYMKLVFAIAMTGILLEQNIRNYRPIIPSEKTDLSAVFHCRFVYTIALILWGMFLICKNTLEVRYIKEFEVLISAFNGASILLFAYTFLLVVVIQFNFKFQLQ